MGKNGTSGQIIKRLPSKLLFPLLLLSLPGNGFVVVVVCHIQLFATPWTARFFCPWDFPRKKYWSGLPFPFPGDLPLPGIKPAPPALAGRFFTFEPAGKSSGFCSEDSSSSKVGDLLEGGLSRQWTWDWRV